MSRLPVGWDQPIGYPQIIPGRYHDPITAIVGSSIVGGLLSGDAQSDAAASASGAQVEAARLGADEQRAAREELRRLLQPYVDAGPSALQGMQGLIGLGGPTAQQTAIQGLLQSPEFAAMTQQGENALLQNASATGGLRGGNTQQALAQMRPEILAQLINQQYNRLGGLATMGQNSAAGVGSAGMQSGNNIAQLLQQSGAAQAGNYLAQGQARANQWGSLSGAIGQFAGLGGFGKF